MSARFRRMAARLWPDSLFGRLAMILFSGLVAAHVLAFVLIALDRIAIEDELGVNLLLWTSRKRSLSSTTSSLKKDPPGSTASLDAISDTFSADGGELEAEPPKRRQANIARLRAALGPGHDANFVYFDPPSDCDGAYPST